MSPSSRQRLALPALDGDGLAMRQTTGDVAQGMKQQCESIPTPAMAAGIREGLLRRGGSSVASGTPADHPMPQAAPSGSAEAAVTQEGPSRGGPSVASGIPTDDPNANA